MSRRAKGYHGIPQFDPEYPKFKKVEIAQWGVWAVTLTDGKTYGVPFTRLKEWMNVHAR